MWNFIQIDELYTALNQIPNIKVYYRDEVPESYHYTYNDRIGV